MLPFGLVVMALLALILGAALGDTDRGPGIGSPPGPPVPQGHRRASDPIPAIEAGLLPWRLAPLSREVVLPSAGHQLVVVGGLEGSTSQRRIFAVNTGSGSSHPIGSLPVGVHDAAGALVAGQGVVFGGGSPTTVAGVESFAPPAEPGHLSPFPRWSASSSGQLPQPRSDASAATLGAATYVVGGYDGARADPSVLATTDGRTFRRVATLPVPVRYPAVAAQSGRLYVFGGEAVSGPDAGRPGSRKARKSPEPGSREGCSPCHR